MGSGEFGLVSGVVPTVFESYVAIRHPSWLHRCTEENISQFDGDPHPGTPIDWHAVALSEMPICIGRTQYRKLPAGGWIEEALPDGGIHQLIRVGDTWISGPTEGVLEPAHARKLLPLLEKETNEPENCWFGIWNGFRFRSIEESGAPLFDAPNRSWRLYQGSLRSIDKSFDDSDLFHHPANFVWPNDRSWCLATEIDLEASYLGGSSKLISAVLEQSELDVIPVEPRDRPVWLANLLQPVVEKPSDVVLRPGFESRENPYLDLVQKLHRGGRFRRFLQSIEFVKGKDRKGDHDDVYEIRR